MDLTLIASLCAICLGSLYVEARPRYIDCQSSSECGTMQCCVIGMGRFSMPSCQNIRDVGDLCLPQGLPFNRSVVYPDNEIVNLYDVYHIHCPCDKGLICNETEGTCIDPSPRYDFNQLDYDPDYNFI